MAPQLNTLIWQQFGAAIDMLENAVTACPDRLWAEEPRFCQLAHHTLFFLVYYLSDDQPLESEYTPPPPFTKSEFEDVPPVDYYHKDELLVYAGHGRERLRRQLTENKPEELF